MTISQYEFFYDGQQRRFLEQLVRAFSGFSYQTGTNSSGGPQTLLVPCQMAQTNSMVAMIQQNMSENTLNACPMITVYQTGLRGRKADLQNPFFVDNLQVFERNIVDGKYGPDRGNAYSVDRLMPLPFEMDVQVDIWTSNLDQKYQLAEQILLVTFPQFEIQNSENALDWSAVTICFVEDDIQFSSRTIPVGTATAQIDIMSIKLRVPFWLTPPAKIRKITRIEEVVANIGDVTVDAYGEKMLGQTVQRLIVTPGDCAIAVDGNIITLLGNKGHNTLPDGTLPSWKNLLTQYGIFREGESQLRLMLTDDIEGPFVAGTLQSGNTVNTLVWTIDPTTLPTNTLLPLDAVIDPMRTSPGHGLPPPVDGTRYLLISDIGPCVAWGALTAHTNDIIQYKSTISSWQVIFDSRRTIAVNYVLNSYTNRQLRWNGREWLMSIVSLYLPGYWRLSL